MNTEPDTQANDYDHVKHSRPKHFKMRAEQFRHKFISHRKESSAS